MTTTKTIIEHKDKLGRTLKEGDCVAYPSHNTLEVGVIKKANPKMLTVWKLGNGGRHYNGSRKYPSDLVLLDGPEVTLYVLKNSK